MFHKKKIDENSLKLPKEKQNIKESFYEKHTNLQLIRNNKSLTKLD